MAGRPAPGHRAGRTGTQRGFSAGQPADGFGRAAPGAEPCLEHARRYVIGLIPQLSVWNLERFRLFFG